MNTIKIFVALVLITSLTAACSKKDAAPAGGTQVSAPPAAEESNDPSKLFAQASAMRDGSNGTPVNTAEAFRLFSKAAEMGERDSMFLLGIMYENGESVPVDYEKALMWLEKSAKAGNGSAPERIKQLKAKMKKK